MPLSERSVRKRRKGTLVLTYSATNVALTHKDQPILSSKRRPYFQTHIHGLGMNKNLVMSASRI
jgi:hypothetical protein